LRLARRLLLPRQLPFDQARVARPLGSTRITGLLSYHGAVRHCASASILCPLRVRRLWALPLAAGRSTSTVAFRLRCIGARLRTFHAAACAGLAPPVRRMPLGQPSRCPPSSSRGLPSSRF